VYCVHEKHFRQPKTKKKPFAMVMSFPNVHSPFHFRPQDNDNMVKSLVAPRTPVGFFQIRPSIKDKILMKYSYD